VSVAAQVAAWESAQAGGLAGEVAQTWFAAKFNVKKSVEKMFIGLKNWMRETEAHQGEVKDVDLTGLRKE
jgi:hypothetical protein